MPEKEMYHGTIYFTNTQTGEEGNVATQLVLSDSEMAFTIRSLATDAPPITIRADDPASIQLLQELMQAMSQVTTSA